MEGGSHQVSTFVIIGLTGSAALSLNPSILEISLLAIEHQDILFLGRQGLPRALNRLTLSFKPQRSPIPIRAMEEKEFLDSSVEHGRVMDEEDVSIIQKFLERLPRPVCLVSYSANLYDYRVIKNQLNRLNQTISRDWLLCTSLRRAVSDLQPGLDSYELKDVYNEVCDGNVPNKEKTAEGVVDILTEIISRIRGTIGWMDLHNELF